MLTNPTDILKGREKKWLAVQMSPEHIAEGSEHNCILRRGVEGFLPIKDCEGNDTPHYMLLNKRENKFGMFQMVQKKIAKEIEVPLIWKIWYLLGNDIYIREDFEEEDKSNK